jgi:NAD(P)-dependent dehydrogenase (short-subunit alcohol dehydrogenase family)
LSNYTLTDEGLEAMFATNHLSYFLLTHVLYPALRRADEPRVVNVSSNSHAFGRINLADPGLGSQYHGLRAYAQAKLANVYFTQELDRLKPDAHLRTYAVSPGLVKTDIGLKHTSRLHAFAWRVRRWLGQTPAQGAGTIVYCATDPSVAMRSGYYWEGCAIKEVFKSARDPDLGRQLWALSQSMCGVSDYFQVEVESGHACTG